MNVIYVPRLGRYVERNPAQQCWTLTASVRHASLFHDTDNAVVALHEIYEDCCEAWHLTPEDFSVRTA